MKLHPSILIPLGLVGLLSCSDPPPQPPAIAISVVLQPPQPQDNPEGRRCNVQPNGIRTYTIGSSADGDHTVENGKDGVELACTVRSNGEVEIELFGPNQTEGLMGSFGLNLNGFVQSLSDGTQNTGTLGFVDTFSGTGQMGTPAVPQCTISPPTAGGMITKGTGAMLASFACPILKSADSPGEGCRASGTFAIEFCKTGEEED